MFEICTSAHTALQRANREYFNANIYVVAQIDCYSLGSRIESMRGNLLRKKMNRHPALLKPIIAEMTPTRLHQLINKHVPQCRYIEFVGW